MKLPQQKWLEGEGAQRILSAVAAKLGITRLVGGVVRDSLLGLPVTDVDLATQLAPAEVVARLQAAGLKAVPTGIAHGTITAVAPGISMEITTLRRDIATDGRHAQIEFTDDWAMDAARRDFTINALYANVFTGEISDYFDGEADIKARRVRFIGEPLARIAEDHLRILRFFRFHARFGAGPIDAAGFEACRERANDLMALSRERIRDELLKLLLVSNPVPTLAAMLAAGILLPVLPEIETGGAERLAELIASEPKPNDIRRLSVLLPNDAALLDRVAYRLRLSNAERRRLVMTAQPMKNGIWPSAYFDGAESVIDRLLLHGDKSFENKQLIDQLCDWQRPKLPATGRDLIARGVAVGPEVSRKLALVEARWIDAGFPMGLEQVAALLDDVARLEQ